MTPSPKTPTAKPGKSTVYVDVEDEITSIIDKLENAKDPLVALVLPKRASVLQSVVNMRLLARSAEKAGKKVVLVTNEPALLPLAGAAGLHVAKDLDSPPELPEAPAGMKVASVAAAKTSKVAAEVAEPEDPDAEVPFKINYEKPVGALADKHEADNPETIELADEDEPEAKNDQPSKLSSAPPKLPKAKSPKVPNFDRFRVMLGLLVAGFIALIIFIYLAIAVLPKATITLNTTSVPVSTSLTLTTSGASSLNEANSTIPAVLKTTQQTANAQVTATGQQNNGVKATGTVTMTATESGATAPSSVPAGAGITSGGLTYITAATTKFDTTHATNNLNGTFTYQATSTTGITAQTGGTKYNVSGATFAVSGRPDVSASGSTSGGTDSIVTVVSQNDLDGAKGTITSAASAAFIKTYEASLASQGLYVLTSTLTTSDPTETASPAVGQAASTTNVTVQITYTLLTIKKSDLQQALADALTKKIDKSQQSVDTNSVLSNATVAVQDQSSPTVATLSITGSASAVPVINAVSVKTQVSGKKSADIINSLEAIPGVKTVNVKFSPFWVSKVPSKPSKITIVQQYTKGTSQ